jgi:hypothetical protein
MVIKINGKDYREFRFIIRLLLVVTFPVWGFLLGAIVTIVIMPIFILVWLGMIILLPFEKRSSQN